MISEILARAVADTGFVSIIENNEFSLFSNSSNGQRYLIFARLTSLPSVEELHERVLSAIPAELNAQPAFRKNCDLIIIHRVDKLADYEKLEDLILSYEEDPYHFKKYFLYFTEAEEQLLQGKNFSELSASLSNQAQFADYKRDPKLPSLYGIAARIFIKIPFLPMPRAERELIPLSVQLSEAVENSGLSFLWTKVSAASIDDGVENFIENIVNEELENIKNSNSGI